MAKDRGRKGAEGFERYYAGVYGERWAVLRAALLAPVRQVARLNAFAGGEIPDELAAKALTLAGSRVVALDGGARVQPKPVGAIGLNDVYVMDAASIFAAAALGVDVGDVVLDLCAAPGGKSLILAERIGESGRLVSNELSADRRRRLKAVIGDYVPPSVRERVFVTGHDGARWCLHETNAYDRILVDAPCSGERHLLASPSEMKTWSEARSKNLAVRQYALLTSALEALKPGGRLVYSTCSISPLENDAVIARLQKRRDDARVLPASAELGEETEHGWMLLPDRTGFGPIYFAVVEKIAPAVSN